MHYILVKVAWKVQYGKHSTREQSRGLPCAILASIPHLSAIFPVMHDRKRYFKWFIISLQKYVFIPMQSTVHHMCSTYS